jgi:hypothetical protein
MRRALVTAAIAASMTAAAVGSALAQAVPAEVEDFPQAARPYGARYYPGIGYRYLPPTAPRVYGYYYAPRVYGYYGTYERPYPRYRGGCGVYHYWNGNRCVDARWNRTGD